MAAMPACQQHQPTETAQIVQSTSRYSVGFTQVLKGLFCAQKVSTAGAANMLVQNVHALCSHACVLQY